MKAPETVKLAFDPMTTDDMDVRYVFKDKGATILWCMIKNGHIVSQSFARTVLDVAEKLKENRPRSYAEFMEVVRPFSNVFGRVIVDKSFPPMFSQTRPDHEFWGGVYMAWTGKRYFKWVVEKKELV